MEEQTALAIEASLEYVGRWNRLISTTNWEKGRIICQWRAALTEAGEPPSACTDEAWSRHVGGISPQHVGRLRRVYERFGEVFGQYPGLYWSHFCAALDWPDAEMYLEGAVQSNWSVSAMCAQRREAVGGPPQSESDAVEFIAAETDEYDVSSDDAPSPAAAARNERCDSEPSVADEPPSLIIADDQPSEAVEAAPAVRPFESLPPLPPDLSEAFELFKLAILNHKVSAWQEISRDDMLVVIDSLRTLTLA